MDEMQKRIAFLERELIETRLQLAVSKSSEDIMRLELSKMSTALARATQGSNSRSSTPDENIDIDMQQQQPLGLGLGGNFQQRTIVPTSNPFPRTNSSSTSASKRVIHRATKKTSSKALKPGSCASGLNLLALAQLDPQVMTDMMANHANASSSSSISSLMGLQRRQRRAGASSGSISSSRGGARLNLNSCASGLDLLSGMNDTSMRSLSSLASSYRPRGNSSRGNSSQHLMQLSRNSSRMSATSADNAGGVAAPRNAPRTNISTNNIALLLGNARLLSASSRNSMRRGGAGNSSRNNNARSAAANNNANNGGVGGNTNRNADWDLF